MASPRPGAGLVLAACLAGWFPGAVGAPDTVQAQARERELYVTALDRGGLPATGLGPADFVVREDGVSREVLRVRLATDPMQIAVLVDNSQAATPAIKDLRDALKAFFAGLRQNDEIALIGFGDRPTILVDYTTSRIELDKGIGRLFGRPDSGSYLLDAIVEVTQGFERREARRPVIVAISTEGAEFSNAGYQQVLRRLRESGAAFHAVTLGSASSDFVSEEGRNRHFVLDQGTSGTGGRRDDLLTAMAFERALVRLAAELSNQYVVTYGRPESLVPPDKIEVATNRPDLTVRGTPVPARTR